MNTIRKIKTGRTHTKQLVLTGLLFALAMALSFAEGAMPSLFPVPGVKLGLANIAVMYTLFFVGKNSAFIIVVMKAALLLMMKGGVAGLLSLCGGIGSVAVMAFLTLVFQERVSYLVLSIFGAVFHNISQFTVASYMYTELFLWPYLPVLLVSGIAAGIVTSVLLKSILPALKRLA